MLTNRVIKISIDVKGGVHARRAMNLLAKFIHKKIKIIFLLSNARSKIKRVMDKGTVVLINIVVIASTPLSDCDSFIFEIQF